MLFNLDVDDAVSELKVQGTMYMNLKHRRIIIGRRNEAKYPTDFAREGDRIMRYVVTPERPYNPLLDALAAMRSGSIQPTKPQFLVLYQTAFLEYLTSHSDKTWTKSRGSHTGLYGILYGIRYSWFKS